MIIAEPAVWDRIIQAHPKIKKFRSKPFPLFNLLSSLYEGSIATGDLCFTSTEEMTPSTNHTKESTQESSSLNVLINPFSNIDLVETSSSNTDKAQENLTPIKPLEKEGTIGKKRKQNQVAMVLENYFEFKKEQTQKVVEKIVETSKQEIDCSIAKCISVVQSIQELTDEEKAKALGLFRCPINREIFMNTTIPSVRLIWLRSQIAA
ncbi:hypothetical protein GUJ93_ZPchr0002g26265 [Zizania palustris]|uniref:Uncharacterized protein n=1 Tax=Zizania palustris TaxID=103762 RepID=A0A8J5S2I1_ZIZPA|nr:hypothetical protein GUJ93_ZPchr0002g26265 [Zizania palustris]